MTLSYKNEDDKCYGATGMTISVVVMERDDMLSAVNLDAEPGDIMEMADSFYFTGNPGLSARSAWTEVYKNLSLSVGMLLGNLMCRRMVLDGTAIDADTRAKVSETVEHEAMDACSLESDEARQLFVRTYNYLYKVFNHPGIQGVARDFSDTLKRRRHLTRFEILEELRALNML